MGIPYGVILHGTELLQMRRHGSGLRKRLIARALLGPASVIVTNSEWTRTMTLQLFDDLKIRMPPDHVVAVPAGRDLIDSMPASTPRRYARNTA